MGLVQTTDADSRETQNELNVCVVGAGTMGAGIAIAFSRGGWQVQLVGRRQASLDRAGKGIEASLQRLLKVDLLSEGEVAGVLDRITMTAALEPLARWNLVVESVAEDMAAKTELLRRVEAAAGAGDTIVTTNTSSLSIDELSAGLDRAGQFVGLHWLNPPELIEVVEIVSGAATEAKTVERVGEWCNGIGKRCIALTRDIPGFVINRLQYALLREAFALVESGVCGYEQVDAAVRQGLGARWAGVGPFESLDLGGLDVHAEVAARLFPSLSSTAAPADVVLELVGQGALGCKTLRGLYGEYSAESVDAVLRRRDETLASLMRLRRSEP